MMYKNLLIDYLDGKSTPELFAYRPDHIKCVYSEALSRTSVGSTLAITLRQEVIESQRKKCLTSNTLAPH